MGFSQDYTQRLILKEIVGTIVDAAIYVMKINEISFLWEMIQVQIITLKTADW